MIPKPHPLSRGLVVMFEGIDGVGKTTQIELVHKKLESAGWPVMTTRNMGGTPIGEAIREVLLSPLERPPLTDFYASLAIQEPLFEVIDTARKEGKIVLMDRGPLSLAAYQVYGAGIDAAVGWRHVSSAMDRLKPEAIVLYEMDPEKALARTKDSRGETRSDYFESKPPDYFKRVAEGFKESAERYPEATRIDASRSIGEVNELTMGVIARILS